MFAYVVDGVIERTGDVPPSARRLDNGDWVLGLARASVDKLAAVGWHEIVDVDRPDDTSTVTHDRSVELVDGVPTVVWTARDFTPGELSALQSKSNRYAVDAAIIAAVAELDRIAAAAVLPTLPSGTLTTAQLSVVVRSIRDAVQDNRAGVQRVARTLKHTVRMVRGDFDGVD